MNVGFLSTQTTTWKPALAPQKRRCIYGMKRKAGGEVQLHSPRKENDILEGPCGCMQKQLVHMIKSINRNHLENEGLDNRKSKDIVHPIKE